MILTLTPNPSVDRTIAIASLQRGEVQRATDSRVDAGGKGINVSRALAANGTATIAVLPIGGAHGRMMTEMLTEIALPIKTVQISDGIRANVALVEPDGTTTKINELGPQLSAAEIESLYAAVEEAGADADWLVCCGSLPRGVDSSFYPDLVQRGRALGAKVAIDSSGEAMKVAVGAGPDLIKPNHEELEELVGRALPTAGDVVAASRELIAGGVGYVVVSLGSRGALLITADEVVHGIAKISKPLSTVGAGDSLLAGLLHALSAGNSPREALATAVAFGAAAVTLPGTEVPGPKDLETISVTITENPDLAMDMAE